MNSTGADDEPDIDKKLLEDQTTEFEITCTQTCEKNRNFKFRLNACKSAFPSSRGNSKVSSQIGFCKIVDSSIKKFGSPSKSKQLSSATNNKKEIGIHSVSSEKFLSECLSNETDSEYSRSPRERKSFSFSSKTEIEKDKEMFSREECIENYKMLIHQKFILQKINTLLQQKIHEYCKEKKLENYFEEAADIDSAATTKYLKQLKLFDEFLASEDLSHKSTNEELEELEDEVDKAEEMQKTYLEQFIEKEREVATKLFSEKTGKVLQEKDLDDLLMKQRLTISELSNIRLNYIKLRDTVEAKENALKNLENFGEGLHLVDYEDLKMENQNYNNKIDQYEEELVRLRTKAVASLESLACIRRKNYAWEYDVEDLNKNIESIKREEVEVSQ